MYPIPESINLNDLIDTEVEQISFTANTVTFHISQIGYFQFNGRFRLTDSLETKFFDAAMLHANSDSLLKLIQQKIVKVSTDENRNQFLIFFRNNQILELINDDQYECMELFMHGNRVII